MYPMKSGEHKSTRKYALMALSETRQYADVPMYIESDRDTMWFRDQFGTTYVFQPWRTVRKACTISALVGCLIGAILVKVIG